MKRMIVTGLGFNIFLALATPLPTKAQDHLRPSGSATAEEEPALLELGQTITRQIQNSATVIYEIQLQVGQFVHVVVLQKGLDVAVSLRGPDGAEIAGFDSLNGSFGRECVSAIAAVSGDFHVEITSSAAAGEYEIRLTDLRDSIPQDKTRIEAEQIYMEGLRFYADGKGESYQLAVEKWEKSLSLWRSLGDKYGEALSRISQSAALAKIRDWEGAIRFGSEGASLFRFAGDPAGEGFALNKIGFLYGTHGEKRKALEYYTQALPLRHGAADAAGEATTLYNTAATYSDLGEKRKALDLYHQVLQLYRSLGDRGNEATTLSDIAKLLADLDEKKNALGYFNDALPLYRVEGDRDAEAITLSNIGQIYSDLGENQKALDYDNQALSLLSAQGNRGAEAVKADTLINMGMVYSELGEKQKALDYYKEALSLHRATGYRLGEAAALNNIGRIYDDQGEEQKALDYFGQALTLCRAVGNRDGEATTLHNIGLTYSHLGEGLKALEYYNLALPLYRAVDARDHEAGTLTNIGAVFNAMGETQKALDCYQKALTLNRRVGNRDAEATTLNNIGAVYDSLGEKQKSLEYYGDALPLHRAVGNRAGEAATLNNIGAAYSALHNKQKARDFYIQALPISNAISDPLLESAILHNLLLIQKQSSPALAIFYGKRALNLIQQVRRNIAGQDKELQKSFLASKNDYYRDVAELLIDQGRLAEAEDVLRMLKEQELKDFTRGQIGSPTAATASFTAREREAESILSQGLEYQELAQLASRTPPQQARFEELDKTLTANNVKLTDFWQALQSVLPATEAQTRKIESSDTQDLLRALPAGTVVVYTLVLDDRLDLMVISPDAIAHKSVAVKRAELSTAIEQLRAAIRDRRNGDALLGPSHRLYEWLVAPIAAELHGVKAQTIAWSLDRVLRYIPVNVLHDGQHYLIERYTNVVFTPGQTNGLDRKPQVGAWKALALGVSKQYRNDLNPLPAVPGELRTIVQDREDQQSHGPLPGRILLDEAFTQQALQQQLQQRFPLVHIASHFVLGMTTDESYLLLGGEKTGDSSGYQLRLSDVQNMNGMRFAGTALLSLSACETAIPKGEADGKEVDSLASIGRQRGAQAVLASLWEVNDTSTGQMMADFYRRWTSANEVTKAEALRAAQLALLHGDGLAQGSHGAGERGVRHTAEHPDHAEAEARYSHPYYWAPFILMGNWL